MCKNYKKYYREHKKERKQYYQDHINPCASFDLSNPSEQRKCFHYTNLRPLWAKENMSKKEIISCKK